MKKVEKLRNAIKQKHKSLVSFSGSVDSAFLAKIAQGAVGKNALADAKNVASGIGIKHKIVSCSMPNNKRFAENPVNRCYHSAKRK